MSYFKHNDRVKCFIGKFHDRIQNEFIWNTEEPETLEIRITKNHNDLTRLVVGLDDFNFNYPEDVYLETDEFIIFEAFEFAIKLLKEGKELETKKQEESLKDLESNLLQNELVEKANIDLSNGSDTHLIELISILKSLKVKKIIFDDDNEIEIK